MWRKGSRAAEASGMSQRRHAANFFFHASCAGGRPDVLARCLLGIRPWSSGSPTWPRGDVAGAAQACLFSCWAAPQVTYRPRMLYRPRARATPRNQSRPTARRARRRPPMTRPTTTRRPPTRRPTELSLLRRRRALRTHPRRLTRPKALTRPWSGAMEGAKSASAAGPGRFGATRKGRPRSVATRVSRMHLRPPRADALGIRSSARRGGDRPGGDSCCHYSSGIKCESSCPAGSSVCDPALLGSCPPGQSCSVPLTLAGSVSSYLACAP